MNFDVLMRWVMALPALLMPGLGWQTAGGPATQPQKITVSSPAPSGTPLATPRPSGSPAPSGAPNPSGKPVASATPAPSGATAAATEIATEQVCPGQSDVSKTAPALTCLTSNARVFHGLRPVSGNVALMAAASAKAQDMQTCGYGHTACGREFSYWITQKGYGGRCYGENIAMGQKSPREVFVAWMNSPGHRANILNKDYRDLGVAELGSAKGPLWVMELGGC